MKHERTKMKRLNLSWWMAVGATASTVLFGSAPMLVAPRPAHALHGAAGDCPHVHDVFDESFSVCISRSLGKKCEISGAEGLCQHEIIDVPPRPPGGPPVPTRGTNCICVREKDRVQALQIDRMYDATKAAVMFSPVLSAIGPSAACSQLGTLLDDILRAKTGILGRGPVQFYDRQALKQVDFVIANYQMLNSFATSCSISDLPSVSAVMSALQAIKLQISGSFGGLLPAED
ncbi:MAG: hypothetical protein HYY12_02555 [Candidatus Methylomirabilis oxyfera]|nr:hypothetical protein [Candidatus Methylomirabilis oxyfera]